MTRVPTTATYNLYLSQMTKQKAAMSDMSYQATTGNKYASYDKYGLSTYRLLSLQNERAVTNKYLETNSITQVLLESQQTSVDSIRSSLTDIRSHVREFYANDLTSMSKNPSEEELISLRNVQEAAFEAMSLIAYYLNTEVDGNYIFGGGKTTVPPVDFSYKTLAEFQAVYDGDILTYPSSFSASLSQMSSSADTLGGVTIEQEILTIKQPFDYIGSPSNKMTFAESSLTANAGTFTGLVAGDQVVVTGTDNNDQTLTVTSVSNDGSLITFAEQIKGETIADSTGVTLTKTYAASTSNQMTFAASSLTANAGTFTGLSVGDQVAVTGTTSNDQTLTITSISDDGSLITFEEAISYEVLNDSSAVALTTVPGGVVYGGSDTNKMTFNDAANILTANDETFTGLVPGDIVDIAGSNNNNFQLTVASVSADGSTIVFNENVTNEGPLSTVNFTKTYSGSDTNEMTFNGASKVLTADTGTFTGLEKGDEITVAGTTGNDQTFTVVSVSEDGDFVTFEEKIISETIPNSSGISIRQASKRINQITDYPGAATNQMTFTSDYSKLTANAGTFFDSITGGGLVAGDVVTVTGTNGNDQTLVIHSVSADGSTIEFEFTGSEAIMDQVLANSATVALTKTYAASSTNQMTFDSATKSLAANTGTFTGLAAGDHVVVAGTNNNNQILTVASVTDDGTTSTVFFEEDVENEGPLTTVTVDKAYRGSQTNTMTFVSPGALTADNGTFSGLAAGDQVVITGTGSMGNDQTMIVASVSEDGSVVRFTQPVTAQTIPNSENVKLQQGMWKFESTFDPKTDITTNSLTGRAGAFSDLKPGKKVLIGGTLNNNHFMTVKSVSKDGSTVFFEENVTDETLNTVDLLNGTANGFVSIKQSTQTGKITAENNIGEIIETFQTYQPLSVDTVNNTLTAAPETFSDLSGSQTITITDDLGQEYMLYVKSVSADGSTLNISTSTPLPNANITDTPLTINTRADRGGFITSSMKGSALQTGDVSFNLNQNSMTATVKGAFSQYNAGDCLIVKGADSNDRMYIVDSVSNDGRTVKFSDKTRIVTEMNSHSGSPITDGTGLTICKTYSIGATVNMTGTDTTHNGLYTVLGVSDDGKELTVRTEDFPEYGNTAVFSSAAFATETYYQGGQLSSGYRISETTEIANDITASVSAFEKIFRALGNIAQGNLLDAENPESASQRVSEALDLLDKALTVNPNEKNGDVTSIQYSVITRLDRVKTTVENQTALQNSLETYISSLTQVDKTEAVTMLLQASENLKTSYSVLSTLNKLSLLNYL